MQPAELDQFLVDYHPSNDTISVNCQWLQTKLLAYDESILSSLCKDKEIEALRYRILALEAAKEIYERLSEANKNTLMLKDRLTIRIWPDGTWQSTENTPYPWLSDDYEIHFVPDNIEPDDYVKDYVCK